MPVTLHAQHYSREIHMNALSRFAGAVARCLMCWLAMGLMMSGSAQAAGSCTLLQSATTLTLPATVAVARDLPNGSMLTGWSQSPMVVYYNCTMTNNTFTGSVLIPAGMTSIAGQTSYRVNYNGKPFVVWKTNLPGIGIAMGMYATVNQGTVTGPYSGTSAGFIGGEQFNGLASSRNGGRLIVALVKIGDITPGTVGGQVAKSNAWIGPLPAVDNLVPSVGEAVLSITPVAVTVLTCQTPDVTIPMGTQGPTEMPAVGPSSKSQTFKISFNNCPSGTAVAGTQAGLINNVQYRIDPSDGTVPGFANVAAVNGNPVAGGVGIQLYDATGAVFPYATNQDLSGFNGTSGGNYDVTLTARYYRTGALSSGQANSTMTLTAFYQ
jgi:major type 1 subunit fimbrin (pilin)